MMGSHRSQSGTHVGDLGIRSQLPGPMDGSDADPGGGKGLNVLLAIPDPALAPTYRTSVHPCVEEWNTERPRVVERAHPVGSVNPHSSVHVYRIPTYVLR